MRELSGEAAYDRYVAAHERTCPDHEPLTRAQWWRARDDVRRLLWRPLFLIYVTLAEAMVEARAHPASVRQGAGYRDALVPLLALAAMARMVIGLATAFWFAGVFVVAEVTQSVLDPWVDVVGLSLGWTAALGMLASLVRMGIAWLLRRREDLLVRLRFVEPGKWDLVWQAVIGTCAALWALAGSGT